MLFIQFCWDFITWNSQTEQNITHVQESPFFFKISNFDLIFNDYHTLDIPVIPSFIPTSLKSPMLKLSQSEVSAVKGLIDGYRQSASFLHRSADELERLLKHCEAFTEENGQVENKNDTIKEEVQVPAKEKSSRPVTEGILKLITPVVPIKEISSRETASSSSVVRSKEIPLAQQGVSRREIVAPVSNLAESSSAINRETGFDEAV